MSNLVALQGVAENGAVALVGNGSPISAVNLPEVAAVFAEVSTTRRRSTVASRRSWTGIGAVGAPSSAIHIQEGLLLTELDSIAEIPLALPNYARLRQAAVRVRANFPSSSVPVTVYFVGVIRKTDGSERTSVALEFPDPVTLTPGDPVQTVITPDASVEEALEDDEVFVLVAQATALVGGSQTVILSEAQVWHTDSIV